MPIPAIEATIDGRPCWERLTGEREKAFAAFAFYRDLGASRTIPDVVKFVKASLDKKYELKERMETIEEGGKPRVQKRPKGTLRADGMALKTLYDWSTKYGWNERCDFYDRHLDRIRVTAAEKVVAQMVTRHLEIGTKAQEIASRRMDKMLQPIMRQVPKKDENGEIEKDNWGKIVLVDEVIGQEVDTLDPKDALRFADIGVKIERLAHGAPIDIRRTQDDGAPVLTTPHGAARDEVLSRIRRMKAKKQEQAEAEAEHKAPDPSKPAKIELVREA